MSISVQQCFVNVASDKYNKENLFAYFLISLVNMVCPIILFTLEPSQLQIGIFVLIILVLSSIFSLGIYYVALHNAINFRKEIFPNPMQDAMKILVIFFKTMFWGFLSFFVLIIPVLITGVLSVLFAYWLSFVGMIISVLLYVVATVFFVTFSFALFFLYIRTLNWKDLFAYKKAMNFIKRAIKPASVFALKSLLLFLCVIIIFFLVMLLFLIITGAIINSDVRESLGFTLFYNFLVCIFSCLSIIYFIDLNAQFFVELREKRILPPLKKVNPHNRQSATVESN